MKKIVETNTSERYANLDDKINEDLRKELFYAVRECSNSWNQYKLLL
ncbi:MAG: hypothetical protein JEZ08_07545 [Clostridiales bacterium]|nr:hypothetical protein [Clostridiales bacterium]